MNNEKKANSTFLHEEKGVHRSDKTIGETREMWATQYCQPESPVLSGKVKVFGTPNFGV